MRPGGGILIVEIVESLSLSLFFLLLVSAVSPQTIAARVAWDPAS
jgi:hypothetical protein